METIFSYKKLNHHCTQEEASGEKNIRLNLHFALLYSSYAANIIFLSHLYRLLETTQTMMMLAVTTTLSYNTTGSTLNEPNFLGAPTWNGVRSVVLVVQVKISIISTSQIIYKRYTMRSENHHIIMQQ